MKIWQADFYRRPLHDDQNRPLWELLVCDPNRGFTFGALCPQSEANSTWLSSQLELAAASDQGLPDQLQLFRPQALSLLQAACQSLGVNVQPTRNTPALKQWLIQRAREYVGLPAYTGAVYDPLSLDPPPPNPIPEALLGDKWGFTAIASTDLQHFVTHEPIPIHVIPDALTPLQLGLPSTMPIPGVVIDGGRHSMPLALWLQDTDPVSLNYIPGAPDGLILEASLVDRWVVATFEDADVAAAAQTFEQRKQQSKGLHFLLVRPDDSGMTHTGVWLLRQGDEGLA